MCVRLTCNFHTHRTVYPSFGPVVTLTMADPPNRLRHRNIKVHQSDELSNNGMATLCRIVWWYRVPCFMFGFLFIFRILVFFLFINIFF